MINFREINTSEEKKTTEQAEKKKNQRGRE
jgi:hypothetical protein